MLKVLLYGALRRNPWDQTPNRAALHASNFLIS